MCRSCMLVLGGFLGVTVMIGSTRADAEEERKPNIIFNDDMGWRVFPLKPHSS